MEFKWGSDGMTGLPHFYQGFEAGEFDDTKLYGCWLVPLRLILDRGILVFNNPSPSSPRTCVPISLEYVAENAAVTRRIREAVLKQERELLDCEIFLEKANVSIFLNFSLLCHLVLHLSSFKYFVSLFWTHFWIPILHNQQKSEFCLSLLPHQSVT